MYCSKCGKEISNNLPVCPHCGQPAAQTYTAPVFVQQPPKSSLGKKLGCGFLFIIGLGIFVNIMESTSDAIKKSEADSTPSSTSSTSTTPAPVPVPTTASKFEGDCGIAASAHLKSDDFINHPQLKINIKNTSDKNISAIQFLAVPHDVYGKDISSSFLTQDKLYTDDLIPAGKSESATFGPFLDQRIKSVRLYVYSVFFEDGTEWGDRSATRSQIQQYGKPIEATFEK